MRDLLAKVAGRSVERPAPVIVAVTALVLLALAAALRLEPDASVDTLVDTGSEAYAATEAYEERFGDDPVVVLVKRDLTRLLLTDEIQTLLALEACLAGNAPGGQIYGEERPAPTVCAEIAEARPAEVVYGPATFLNQFALQAGTLIEQQAEQAVVLARQAYEEAVEHAREQGLSEADQEVDGVAAAQGVIEEFQGMLRDLEVRYGQSGIPRLTDPRFVSSVVFDSRTAERTPKARFAYLFPSSDSALVSVRLRPDLTESERREAIALLREAVDDEDFALGGEGEYVVSGIPVVFEGLADVLTAELTLLLGAAIVLMALTLLLVLGRPLRLLPLAVALGAASLTLGILAIAGGTLTMASIAVLPVLIGLGVDYAIQFQARFREQIEGGDSPPRAAAAAAASGGPVIGTACLATAAGFLVLLLSPIPMVRLFGVALVIGVALAFAIALTAGIAALSLVERRGAAGGVTGGSARPVRGEGGEGGDADAHADSQGLDRLRSWWDGAVTRARSATERPRAVGARLKQRGRGQARRALALSIARPGLVLLVALGLSAGGWLAATQTEVISDVRELVPRDLGALADVDELQEETGVAGEIAVTVTAEGELTSQETIAWMTDLERRVLERSGFEGDETSCRDEEVELCPSIALSDLFGEQGVPSQERIEGLLAQLPPYFEQAVLARECEVDERPCPPDRVGEPEIAVIGFGVKALPFDRQKQVIEGIREELASSDPRERPPEGVEAQVVGLPVLAADANAQLESNRHVLAGAALLVVALVLLAIYRNFRRAFVPLIPIAMATGWTALVIQLAGVPLNPMSATLAALVIAIATEFSVIIAARYEAEREAGRSVGDALRHAYQRTGVAVLASGLTAIAGFAALIATDIRMLRDFGLVTVFDLAVALAGVLLVLPAALVWAENGFQPFGDLLRRRRDPKAPAPAVEAAGEGDG